MNNAQCKLKHIIQRVGKQAGRESEKLPIFRSPYLLVYQPSVTRLAALSWLRVVARAACHVAERYSLTGRISTAPTLHGGTASPTLLVAACSGTRRLLHGGPPCRPIQLPVRLVAQTGS